MLELLFIACELVAIGIAAVATILWRRDVRSARREIQEGGRFVPD